MHDLTPHAAGFQHVRLVDAGHLVTALARGFERLARDALHLVLAVFQRVVGALAGGAVRAAAFFVVETLAAAEVQAARQLADNHHVHAVHDLGLEGGRVGQRGEDLHGTQVRVQAQRLADAQQALLGTRLRGVGGIPLRTADRRQQHGVGRFGHAQRLVRQRGAARIDGAPAQQRLGVGERRIVLRAHRVQHLDALGDDLGADAVAGKQADVIGPGH